jgi:uncharacterized protein YqgC (DUF456 family)
VEVILLILAMVFVVGGIIFSVLPPLPGPILSYLGILAAHFSGESGSFSTFWLVTFGVLTIAVTLFDVLMPAIATRKFGGTKAGIYGGLIGTLVGIIVPIPFGIIWGPLLGAIVGDLVGGNQIRAAVKSGFGSFLGFVIATFLKVMISIGMGVAVVWRIGEVVVDAMMGLV